MVGCDEESVGRSIENSSFVEERRSLIFDQNLELRVRAQEGKERVIIDQKRSVFGMG